MTAYKKISSKICIARVYDAFQPNYTDWEGRTPNWINSAIAKIGAYPMTSKVQEEIEVFDYKARIPSDIKTLEAIMYNGSRLDRITKLNNINSDDMSNQQSVPTGYSLDENGFIYTTFETGTIVFYYRQLPVEYDTDTKLYFPMIEDREHLLDAIDYYILYRILQRGHKVGNFSLSTPNKYLNPGLMWDEKRKIARNKVNAMDDDARNELSRIMQTFLMDKNRYYNDIRKTNN